MSVLPGSAATAGLSASTLGLSWAAIPAGTYEVGSDEYKNNPVRKVTTDRFELASTPATNAQRGAMLAQLGGQTTVLMIEAVRDRCFAILARGTQEEVGGIENQTLRNLLAEMNPVKQGSSGRVMDYAVEGALQTFDFGSSALVKIIPVTLEAHLPFGFERPNQPALVTPFEASAYAALFGLRLPTGEMWEVAAGDLRDEKYRKEEELRRVAHFPPASATIDVQCKEPNRYGLYDMLGNVWEAMANRYEIGSDHRELRGGSWDRYPVGVRAAFRVFFHRDGWGDRFGFRLARA